MYEFYVYYVPYLQNEMALYIVGKMLLKSKTATTKTFLRGNDPLLYIKEITGLPWWLGG